MADRATAEQIAEWMRIANSGDDVADWWYCVSGAFDGFQEALAELSAERARSDAAVAELAETKRIRHGDPHMFGAVHGFELGEAEGQRERVRLRHLVDVLRKSRQMWRDRATARVGIGRTERAEAKAAAKARLDAATTLTELLCELPQPHNWSCDEWDSVADLIRRVDRDA